MKTFEKTEQDEDTCDAILSTGEQDMQEELDNLGGYREYVREQFRLGED
jgi:hypothetical protein